MRRIGFLRHAAFGGLLVSHEMVTPADRAVIVPDSGLLLNSTGFLGGPFPSYRNVRFNGVVGSRNLRFLPVRGFDALDAVQDVATGVQVGHGSPTSFAAVRLAGETRYDRQTTGSLEFGVGRRARLPFQLALGDPDGGVRRNSDSRRSGRERELTHGFAARHGR